MAAAIDTRMSVLGVVAGTPDALAVYMYVHGFPVKSQLTEGSSTETG